MGFEALGLGFGEINFGRWWLRVYASKDRAKLEIDPKIKILKLCQNKAYHMPD